MDGVLLPYTLKSPGQTPIPHSRFKVVHRGVFPLNSWYWSISLFLPYYSRFLKKKPLLIRLQLNTLLTCILTFAVYIVISLSTNTVYFSKAACIGLGSAFYVLLLSSIFWLSTEPLVSIVFVRKLKSVQHNYSNVVLKAACINYGTLY